MTDTRYEVVHNGWLEAISVPRWLLSPLHAADRLRNAEWNKKIAAASAKAASDAQDALAFQLTRRTWGTGYELSAALDTADYDGMTLLQMLSDALWIDPKPLRLVLEGQWRLWDQGKQPADPSQALLTFYKLDDASLAAPPAATVVVDAKSNESPVAETPAKASKSSYGIALAIAAVGLVVLFAFPKMISKR